MRTSALKDVERAASALVDKGFRQMKTQMAVDGLTPAQEIERIRVVRNTVGADIALMVDINQRWSVHEAIAVGARIEDLGLTWLEDPTSAIDHQGLGEIASALTTPICAGEYLYGIEPHRQSLAHHSVDIVMIDVLRAGGITGWMKIAAMAEAFNRPVVSHLLPEIQVHTIAAAPNGMTVEYMPWTQRLFEAPPMPAKGEMTVPTGAGLGLRFAPDLFEKYAAS
jgi:L-alanine-DL-glutamate epimerase-like enolase superfamily enzyme